jgi:hypothetical protein
MGKKDTIRLHVWTEHFLGTRAKGEQLLALLESIDGGRWTPDKWGHFEPVRTPYTPESRQVILTALTEERGGRISNDINFTKKKPGASIYLTAWRGRLPGMNRIWCDFDTNAFAGTDGTERMKRIVADLIHWSGGVYATARPSRQAHYRMAQKTPEERLERMDWLTFFGEPYLELFGGRSRVKAAPCYSVEECPEGLLLVAAPTPDSPEITEFPEVLLKLEEYLGADAFAGRGYPDVPCRVPRFDLSETVNTQESSGTHS